VVTPGTIWNAGVGYPFVHRGQERSGGTWLGTDHRGGSRVARGFLFACFLILCLLNKRLVFVFPDAWVPQHGPNRLQGRSAAASSESMGRRFSAPGAYLFVRLILFLLGGLTRTGRDEHLGRARRIRIFRGLGQRSPRRPVVFPFLFSFFSRCFFFLFVRPGV